MLVKVNNGAVSKYPYSTYDLKKDNPQVSFPENIPDSILSQFNVFSVRPTEIPTYSFTQGLREVNPVNNNGWHQVWEVYDLTEKEISEKISSLSSDIRLERNQKLQSCDWTQLVDSPVNKLAWSEYRQKLRDITKQPGFPEVVLWPIEPT